MTYFQEQIREIRCCCLLSVKAPGTVSEDKLSETRFYFVIIIYKSIESEDRLPPKDPVVFSGSCFAETCSLIYIYIYKYTLYTVYVCVCARAPPECQISFDPISKIPISYPILSIKDPQKLFFWVDKKCQIPPSPGFSVCFSGDFRHGPAA